MKKITKILIPILIIVSLLFYFKSKNTTNKKQLINKKTGVTKKVKKDSVKSINQNITKNSSLNKDNKTKKSNDSILFHNDYIEIIQTFKGKGNEITSKKYNLNLKNHQFLSLSAYIFPRKSNVNLYYRYYDGKKWSNWNLLPEDKEINNKKRTVFGLINIYDNIEIIQFKSNKEIEKVVFNIFTP